MNDQDRYQYERERELYEVEAAIDTVSQFIGGPTGEDLRRLLLDLAHLPTPVPPEQERLPLEVPSIPF